MRRGRPLRFLAATLAGWAGLRTVVLWPVPEMSGGAFAAPAAPMRGGPTARAVAGPLATLVRAAAPAPDLIAAQPAFPAPRLTAAADAGPRTSTSVPGAALLAEPVRAAEPAEAPPNAPQSLVAPASPDPRPPGRLSASLWAIGRPDGTGGGLGASQLGGSQAGARVAYALGGSRRVAIVGRVSTPLEGRGREAALGAEWRPTRLPVRLFAEQRFALDGAARGGPGAGVIGGLYEPLPHGFRLEAYGQAGAIKRDRLEGFADGAARVVRPVAAVGGATLDLGAGAWGGAQRGAKRVDVGPTVGLAAPVGGRTIRLTLDYRARIAGRARPGSGPALSVGTDF